MATQRQRLTNASVARLHAASGEYTVWDTRTAGLGVRVRPTGHRTYVYHNRRGEKARRHTLGPVETMDVAVARAKCLDFQLELSAQDATTAAVQVPTFSEFVAGEWKTSCLDGYKASSRKGIVATLAKQLVPSFGVLYLDQINVTGVTQWFDRYSTTAPSGANHALDLLRQIMNQAIKHGYVRTNTTRGIKRNPRPSLTRFLSLDEIRRLHAALDQCVAERPTRAASADIVRLLLLTGCRKSEIMHLQWREVHGDGLDLSDAKTGPRRVFLNPQARAILDRQPRAGSPYVFPSPKDRSRPRSSGYITLWYLVRKRAGIEDVRLHDLRHTVASHAVMNGIPLPTVARLLGHRGVRMTLRYAHVHDREVAAAAERIGQAITDICTAPDL